MVADAEPLIDTVSALVLAKDSISREISFPGELTSFEKAELYAKVPGYVRQVRVDIGDAVRKGEIMAVLDAPEMSAAYAQTNAEMQAARSKYLGSLDAYQRVANAAKVEGTIAGIELERARNQMMADSAALEATKARRTATGQMNEYLQVRAPFNGIITRRNIDPGSFVGTAGNAPMLVVENSSILRLRLPIPEMYTATDTRGMTMSFSVEAYPQEQFQATLSRTSGAIDQLNRTETWEFLIPNNDRRLKPGMYANAKIRLGNSMPTFLVPSTAVVTNQERRFVIRLSNGKSEWVDVTTGISSGNRMEIFGKLNEGDTLVTKGTDEIRPGKLLAATVHNP
jgi:RND family efflux transporter MFP subunit